jgi:hypothetical protein
LYVLYFALPFVFNAESQRGKELPMALSELRVLPSNRIVVRNGKVAEIKEWIDWNGEHQIATHIKRLDGERFQYYISWGDGGTGNEGSLDDVVNAFHPDIGAMYRELFTLEKATYTDIRKTGLAMGAVVEFK